MKTVRCQCGQADGGEACAWEGDVADTVLVEYMPECHRSSHAAAGNSGEYPANGSMRLRLERNCAETLVTDAGEEWARILE